MAEGVYDSQKFEQKELKMAAVKILFMLDIFLTKCVSNILLKIFSKVKVKALFHLFVVVFMFILAGLGSYMTPT
jgi:hypothetical protein